MTEAMWKQLGLVGSRACGIRRQIRDGMDVIVSRMTELAWVEVRSRFVALHDALRAHERAENEMLQSVYLEDIGGRG